MVKCRQYFGGCAVSEVPMSYRITQEDILAVSADAAVVAVEMTMRPAGGPVFDRLAETGGEALLAAVRRVKFLPIGSACAIDACGLPYPNLILTAAPRWLTGKANELLALRRCYESVLDAAEGLGCRTLVTPFLSSQYYRFPREEAVRIALEEASRRSIETVFVPGTEALEKLSRQEYRRPEIVSYVGYYRDAAIFALSNGLFARVDLRPELRQVDVIPYFEACYREGNNPLQAPLPAVEIARLRRIYEETDW